MFLSVLTLQDCTVLSLLLDTRSEALAMLVLFLFAPASCPRARRAGGRYQPNYDLTLNWLFSQPGPVLVPRLGAFAPDESRWMIVGPHHAFQLPPKTLQTQHSLALQYVAAFGGTNFSEEVEPGQEGGHLVFPQIEIGRHAHIRR
jgi:hypothetical protein